MTPTDIRHGINDTLSSSATFAAQCRELGRRSKALQVNTVADAKRARTKRLLDDLFPGEEWDREHGAVERKRK